MAQRATGFAKKPPAAAVEVPRVEIRTPLPDEYIEPPDPIPVDLAPLIAPYRKRGRITVRIERLPHRARLSHGQNNGDRSWSVALDELEGLEYLPANSADEIQSLAVRIIRVDGGDAATLAVLDYPLPTVTGGTTPKHRAAPSTDDSELRKLREELAKATATLEERTFELAELRRSATPKEVIEAELATLRANWEAEVEDRLALAAKAAAADLEKSRTGWQAEEEARNLRVEKLARDRARQDAEAALAKAQTEWKAQEAARLAAAEAKWRQQSAKALADAKAEFAKLGRQSEPVRARNDDAELRRLREEFDKAKASLAERDQDLAKAGAVAESVRNEKAKSGKANDELARAKASLAERENELAQTRATVEALRDDKAKLARLNDELTRSKTVLADREMEVAKARSDAETLRSELDKTRAALATRDVELRQSRTEAAQTRAEAQNLRNDGAELRRATSELASAKASLAVRDAELARTRTSQEEARNRWRQESDDALSDLRKKWEEGEADRLAAKESEWRRHSDMAIAEVVARLEQEEAKRHAEAERSRAHESEIQRLSADLAQVKARVSERETELVQARLAHEQARADWLQESEAAIAKAHQAWKAGEAERIAASQSDSMEQANLALADMTGQIKQLEGLLTEAREHNKKLRSRGDSDDFRQLRKEFASVQATLASRESELMQLRSDHEIDRERWTSEARVAVRRADQNWHAEELEESERQLRVQTTKKLVRDGLLAVAFVGLAMLGYYRLAPMLANSQPEILQSILDQAGIPQTRQPPPGAAQIASQPEKPSLVVLKSVNLRAKPSTGAAVLGSLPRGAKVSVIERSGNWVHIQTAQGAGKPLDGWAFKSFMRDDEKRSPAAPK